MKRNAVEWAVLAVSVIAIIVVVGALVLEGLRESAPADVQVTLHVDDGRDTASGYVIPVTVRNLGSEAAEEVVIEANADAEGSPETSEVRIALLAAGTSVEAAFGFSARPAGAPTVRVVSYVTP